MKTNAPYGMWKSPIDESFVAQRGRYGTIRFDETGALYFSGSRSGESFFTRWSSDAGWQKMNGTLPIGGAIFYGGGDFDVRHEKILFASPRNGLFQRSVNNTSPQKITQDTFSIGSPAIAPDGSAVAYIASDGTTDQIALLPLDGESWAMRWIFGADFYMQPEWSPDMRYFAWTEWNHPHMAWEDSRVMLAALHPQTKQIETMMPIAGVKGNAASQPRFAPDGKTLAFIRSNGEWDDLVLFHLESGEERTLITGDHFLLAPPAFVQGIRTLDWTPDGKRIFFLRMFGPRHTLCAVDVASGEVTEHVLPGYTRFDSLAISPYDGSIALFAGSLTHAPQVILLQGERVQIIDRMMDAALDESYLPQPLELSWSALDGRTVHGIFYAPKNPSFQWIGIPPAVVNIHGGPTSLTELQFNPEMLYFTSRGYGWLEVNYRGSAGYGMDYLMSLNGYWGNYDVEDAITGANCIGAMGLVNRERLMIKGGSAGGYTVLNALIHFPGAFRAGASSYGVTNLYDLAIDTHKLEKHYTDSLVGKLPDAVEKYDAWSPLFHAREIKAPLAIFQGGKDPVVPLSQAEQLISRLRCPHVYRMYPEEGHGFKQPEAIKDYLQTLIEFMHQYV